jgi:hypothetical protein
VILVIYAKVHSSKNGEIIAMCDEELLGRIITDGRIEINLDKYAGFYKGSLVSEEKAGSLIGNDVFSANLVGKRSVEIFEKKGLVSESQVRNVGGVKFVQIFNLD